ncbi:hypothetical protein AN219_37820 [Streptomyces nanshensis]|nr:hypothetical protein AN219_37820 [Streptomyces nanshensis]
MPVAFIFSPGRVSSLDVTFGADVAVSLTVLGCVLIGDVVVSTAGAAVCAVAVATAARSYVRYQRLRIR